MSARHKLGCMPPASRKSSSAFAPHQYGFTGAVVVAIEHRHKQQGYDLSVRTGSLSSNNCWAEQPISRTSFTACQASKGRLPVEACIASGVKLLPCDSTTSLTASMTKLSAVLLDSQQARNVKAAQICPEQAGKYTACCKHRIITCI